jgi:recombinational DNA repair protein RecR
MKKITKKYRDRLDDLTKELSHVYYEVTPGIHTYSQCSCGRHITRSGVCHICRLDKMEEIIKTLK